MQRRGQSLAMVGSAVSLAGVLYCKWLTNVDNRPAYNDQLMAAWKDMMRWQSHWWHLGPWSQPLWQSLMTLWH